MSLPTSQPILDEPEYLPQTRRRRRSILSPRQMSVDQRTIYLDRLARRSTPTFDYFLFSLLAGILLGAALLLQAPAFLILAALAAPFLGPVVGLSLATIIGSGRFFLLILWSALLGPALFFLGGYLGGAAVQLWPGWAVQPEGLQIQLHWSNLVLLSLGIVLAMVALVRSEQKPLLPNVALVYALYLPVGMAGFGLAAGLDQLWPVGLIVFAVFLAWSILLGAIALVFLGFRPLSFFGYLLGGSIVLTSLVVFLGFSGIGLALRHQLFPTVPGAVTLPSATPTLTEAPLQAPLPDQETPTPSWTVTAANPTTTLTPTATLIPSATPTVTITHAPTPVWAMIHAEPSNGAVIRAEPNRTSKIVISLLNGKLVEVLPDVIQDGGIIWVHIRLDDGVEGWIVQSLLMTATPAPEW